MRAFLLRSALRIVPVLFAVVSAAACHNRITEPTPVEPPFQPPFPPPVTLQSVVVTAPAAMTVSETRSFSVKANMSDGSFHIPTFGVTFTSSDSRILAVNQAGVGSAFAAGSVTVTALYQGRLGSAVIAVNNPVTPADRIDRGETQTSVNGVMSHACPANYAMAGINFGGDGNTFLCRYTGPVFHETFATVVREGMLACAPGSYMTALNIERNYLRCTSNANAVSGVEVTGGLNTAQITECSGSSASQARVMVGFHKERRAMLCAYVARRF